jgi:hypothetical protein
MAAHYKKIAPPVGWVALSCDGSFVKESGLAGSGMIPRDSNGAVIFSAYSYLFFFAKINLRPRLVHSLKDFLQACNGQIYPLLFNLTDPL